MGPLATARSSRDVRAGIARLAAASAEVASAATGEVEPRGVPAGKGFFVGADAARRPRADARARRSTSTRCSARSPPSAPTTARAASAAALVAPRRGRPGRARLLRRPRLAARSSCARLAAWNGRLYLGSDEDGRAGSPAPARCCPQLSTAAPAAPAAARSSAACAAWRSTCSAPRSRATRASWPRSSSRADRRLSERRRERIRTEHRGHLGRARLRIEEEVGRVRQEAVALAVVARIEAGGGAEMSPKSRWTMS